MIDYDYYLSILRSSCLRVFSMVGSISVSIF
jgi:hypothetical protein